MELSTSKRSRISDKQKSILERFYGSGMVGTGHYTKTESRRQLLTLDCEATQAFSFG